jgi:MerR family transcriptional regulator, heat shock protein HspR
VGADPTPVEDERGGVYTIAVASRLTGMHAQTLRKYERAGLLVPSRPHGNQRLYSDADIARLRRIRYLVETRGLNLAGLELALAMADRLDAMGADSTHAELQAAMDEASDMSREP